MTEEKEHDLAPEALVRRTMPEKYGSIARRVDSAMALSLRPCRGRAVPRCDEDGHCDRHARAGEVADRLERLRARRRG